MVSSIFVAKIVGLWIFVVGIALLRNGEMFQKMAREYVKSVVSLFLGGTIAFLFGAFIVASHNVWVFAWPVIITLFGWAALIKGIAILIFPESVKEFSTWYLEKVNLSYAGWIYLILGGFLTLKGYF